MIRLNNITYFNTESASNYFQEQYAKGYELKHANFLFLLFQECKPTNQKVKVQLRTPSLLRVKEEVPKDVIAKTNKYYICKGTHVEPSKKIINQNTKVDFFQMIVLAIVFGLFFYFLPPFEWVDLLTSTVYLSIFFLLLSILLYLLNLSILGLLANKKFTYNELSSYEHTKVLTLLVILFLYMSSSFDLFLLTTAFLFFFVGLFVLLTSKRNELFIIISSTILVSIFLFFSYLPYKAPAYPIRLETLAYEDNRLYYSEFNKSVFTKNRLLYQEGNDSQIMEVEYYNFYNSILSTLYYNFKGSTCELETLCYEENEYLYYKDTSVIRIKVYEEFTPQQEAILLEELQNYN